VTAYRWWLFLHLVGIFAFLTGHGVSVGVAFRLRKERDPNRVLALRELSAWSVNGMYAGILLLLIAGIVMGFLGDWWDMGWIWVSLGILVATIVAMAVLATPYYKRVAFVAKALAEGSTAVKKEEFAAMLSSSRPLVVAAIGFVALLAILYLMLDKPF
jgi:MFS family permease